jgi:hypothetical protein
LPLGTVGKRAQKASETKKNPLAKVFRKYTERIKSRIYLLGFRGRNEGFSFDLNVKGMPLLILRRR